MTDTCVCGGSRARPNPDCERCEWIAEIDRLRAEVERLTPPVPSASTFAGSTFAAEMEVYFARKAGWLAKGVRGPLRRHPGGDAAGVMGTYDEALGRGDAAYGLERFMVRQI